MEGKLIRVGMKSGMEFHDIDYDMSQQVEGVKFIVAIDWHDRRHTVYISAAAIEYFEVEHEHEQETVQDTPTASDG